ncbi:hypothetical protein N478_01775 [Pseudoalteromonas luteoviolacea S4060-1]|uniref:Uncharacterized protein n=1 Tax=Pseudoalteromonas luteoviolacea S4060-1 TaxID=1365257 RepID=A0A167N4U4_9GAMM|nr:hypothetical protein N478_01775 [Pseudoalteromonas luteoviolacea S4060-1]
MDKAIEFSRGNIVALVLFFHYGHVYMLESNYSKQWQTLSFLPSVLMKAKCKYLMNLRGARLGWNVK